MALNREKKQCHCVPHDAIYFMVAPRIRKFWKLKPYYLLLECFRKWDPLICPEEMSCDNVLSPCLTFWCVHSKAGASQAKALPCEGKCCRTRQCFYGKCSHFYRPGHWLIRLSSLTQDHTGSWRNSWQRSLCLPAKRSFPETTYLSQETSLLIAA